MWQGKPGPLIKSLDSTTKIYRLSIYGNAMEQRENNLLAGLNLNSDILSNMQGVDGREQNPKPETRHYDAYH
jgi:hypothetical protein